MRIEVGYQNNLQDPEGEKIKKESLDLGIKGLERARVIQVYLLEGKLGNQEIEKICSELLADPICQKYAWQKSLVEGAPHRHIIEVAYNPGVTDPVEESVKKAIKDLDVEVKEVRTAKKYVLEGKLSKKDRATISQKLLFNKTIQHLVTKEEKISLPGVKYEFKLVEVDLLEATDKELIKISQEGQLWLNLEEMKTIQAYFKKIGRNPADIELETLAQTWSEHCVHKTFKSPIEFNGQLLRKTLWETIMSATKELAKPWCVSVFCDNAGIISFDEADCVSFKVETHNHPSALEPYGGAGTGIGGVIRDILGVGLGAKPILNTDVFCFAPPDYPQEKLPEGILHPQRIMKGVVSGVRDYGNRMGIPTANGAIFFDEHYLGNPLVYCGTVGIMPQDKCFKEVRVGDVIVLLGGRTGRDGIHGVTFASGELSDESEETSSSSVQIGNPICEKKMTDLLLQAREQNLYRAITDCGGGGLSSAIGELASTTGAEVDLEKVPLKYQGLSYREIWISESQERMIIFTSPPKLARLKTLAQTEGVAVTIIGKVTADKKLRLKFQGKTVGELAMDFLHHGLPLPTKKATWQKPHFPEPEFPEPKNLTEPLKKILSSWNVCSRESVIRQYDHEVQGGSVLKPLVGTANDGPGDACIIKPKFDSNKGLVISNGLNPKYGFIDPYWMAASAIDEALRQIIAVGGSLEKVALLDNFSWGNPQKKDRLGGLVRAVQACYDIAKVYGTPFISGKDSLNNEYQIGDKTTVIPPTLLISAMAVMEDTNKALSMDLKKPGNLIYLIGTTYQEMGGSHYYDLRGFMGATIPKVDPVQGKKIMDSLSQASTSGLVQACHDLSEGGLGVALAEMALAGGWGAKIHLKDVPRPGPWKRNDFILFSESNSRFLVEVSPADQVEFEKIMNGNDFAKIGEVTKEELLVVYGLDKRKVVKATIWDLKEAWQKPLRASHQPRRKKIKTPQPLLPQPSQFKISPVKTMVLRTAGTNCDQETCFAFEKVGSKVDLVHINELLQGKKHLKDYQILALPGGFTYGDDISAGKILANELKYKLQNEFLDDGKLIIGICNGFQALIKAGLLPALQKPFEKLKATLANNDSCSFQCEWVSLKVVEGNISLFTKGINFLELPIAHGEGKFIPASADIITQLKNKKQIVLEYFDRNPNGSAASIAGISDPTGRILGLMPHPERYIFPTQHPRWTREGPRPEGAGLAIFRNAVEYTRQGL